MSKPLYIQNYFVHNINPFTKYAGGIKITDVNDKRRKYRYSCYYYYDNEQNEDILTIKPNVVYNQTEYEIDDAVSYLEYIKQFVEVEQEFKKQFRDLNIELPKL